MALAAGRVRAGLPLALGTRMASAPPASLHTRQPRISSDVPPRREQRRASNPGRSLCRCQPRTASAMALAAGFVWTGLALPTPPRTAPLPSTAVPVGGMTSRWRPTRAASLARAGRPASSSPLLMLEPGTCARCPCPSSSSSSSSSISSTSSSSSSSSSSLTSRRTHQPRLSSRRCCPPYRAAAADPLGGVAHRKGAQRWSRTPEGGAMRVVVISLSGVLECSPAAAGIRLEQLCALLPPLRLRLGTAVQIDPG